MFPNEMKRLPSDIQNLIKSLDLKLLEVMQEPDENRRRFYSLHVKECAGKQRDLVLKVFGRGDPSVVSAFEKEVQFLEKVVVEKLIPLKDYVPHFVDSGNGKRPWCLREYAEEYVGDICVDFGIRKEFLTPQFREDFLEFFSALRNGSDSFKGDEAISSFSVHGAAWYQKDFDFYRKHVKKISPECFNRVAGLLEEKVNLLDLHAKYLVHGDLYPKNVFWSGGLKVSDWELLHLGVPLFDPCFVWALAWQDSKWQEKFLVSFKRDIVEFDSELAESLRVVQAIVLLRFIRHSEVMLDKVLSVDDDEEAIINANRALNVHKKNLEKTLNLG